MKFTPLFPTPTPAHKPLSNTSRAYLRGIHPLLTTGGQNALRAQFTISTWLCAGAALQSLLVLLPLPVYYTVLPSIALLAYKIINTYLVLWGWKGNHLMQGVIKGRHSAIFPNRDGGFERSIGESVGGGGVCVFLLGARSNSPLGLLSPNFASLASYFGKMFADLRKNSEQWGFLGSSTYANISDRLTQPEHLYVIYFRSSTHLHAFARGKAHQDGWDWWVKNEKGLGDLAISHEIWDVPEGGWETIYHNYGPSGFAATSHAIEEKGGVKQWACPIVAGDHNALKSSVARMGTVKGAGFQG